MHLPDPEFPPILTGHPIKAPAKAFETACRRAAEGELGAADLVWARDTQRAEMALILEPEVSRRQALQIKPLSFAAMADSLGALMPPKTAVHLRWPNSILLNGAVAGQLQFALAQSRPDEVPDWLVAGVSIQVASPHIDREPGEAEQLTSIFDEGGGELDRTQMLRSISAHMLSWLQVWQDDGFKAVADPFIGRVEGYEHETDFNVAGRLVRGRVLGMSDEMQLLVRLTDGKTVALENEASAPTSGMDVTG